jgi:hypothetical protein
MMDKTGGGVEGQVPSSDFRCLTRQLGVGDIGTGRTVF